MASDFSIAQFRFLERLLIVHGHWCYKRIALMVPTVLHLFLNTRFLRTHISRNVFYRLIQIFW